MEMIGKFDVIEMLGRGAMGVVYRGHDPSLARDVAIKLMTANIEMDPDLRTRFFREAQAAGSLQHPNIITIYELGESEGHPYMAMEFVPGRDLDEIISAREPLTVVEKVDIVEQVCRGLSYAHERSIVHRDVKPANIRVTELGQVKLMDFGVAHLISSELTRTGSLIGTPYYMAPEVVEGQPVDARSDIFSLGATFYELLAYSRPFQGDTIQTVFARILSSEPAPLRDLGFNVSPLLQKVLDRSLAKKPRDRYADTGEFLKDLMDFWETVPGSAQARAASTASLAKTAARAARKSRARRWKRIIPAALGATVFVAGLTVVGGGIVWPLLFDRPESVEQPSLSSGPEPQAARESAAPAGGDRGGREPEALPQAATSGQPVEPPKEAVAEPQPPVRERRPPARTAPDRRPYDSARRLAEQARDLALEVGAAQLAAGPFESGERLRGQAEQAAERGRFDEAAREMGQARSEFERAHQETLDAWLGRLDSARADLETLRDLADPSHSEFARAERLWQEGDAAVRISDYRGALERMTAAAAAFRLAEEVEEPEEAPPERSTEEIVAETLAALHAAIEAENLSALEDVWAGLTPDELSRFASSFEIMSDLKVTFDIRSVERMDGRIRATVHTTYDFFNTGSRRSQSQGFEQVFELEERGGRWVIVSSTS